MPDKAKIELFNVVSTEVCQYIATLEDDEDFDAWMDAIRIMRVGFKNGKYRG